MTDDFRRELGQTFDQMSGSPSRDLTGRVRSVLANPPENRGPYWIAGVAAASIAVLVVGVLFIGHPLNRAPFTAGPGVHSSPSPSASPGASPPTTPSPGPTPAFVCSAQPFSATSSSAPLSAYIDALRTGSHTGYDRVTIEFQNGQPGSIEVHVQSGTGFTTDPRGTRVTLKGSNGILITIRGADFHTAYSGPTDIVTGYSGLAEVRSIQDFEGVVQFALGINAAACFHATLLANPTRLVIDVPAA